MSMFADDAKIMRRVANEENCVALSQDLNRISKWSRKWDMTFNNRSVKCWSLIITVDKYWGTTS